MTDKEKLDAIRAEIHRLVDVRGYDREIANDLFTFMDSLPNEPVSEELEEYINKLSKQFPEVSFAKLTRIAVRVAKWMMKDAVEKTVEHSNILEQEEPIFKVGDTIQKKDDNSIRYSIINKTSDGYRALRGLSDTIIIWFSEQGQWELVKEPVSEDLEVAAEEWDESLYRSDAFKAGAKWQKEKDSIPVSEDLEAELDKYIKDNFTIDKEQLDRFGIEEKDYMYSMDKSDMEKMVRYFTGNYKIPISDDLEEAAKLYVSDSLCITGEEDWDDVAIEALNTYKAGAKWQMAQMVKDATEVTVHIEAGIYPYIPQMELYDYDKDVPLAKEGDKYNVVLIKED